MKVSETSMNQAAAAELSKARQAEAVAREAARTGAAAPGGDADRVEVSGLAARLLERLSTDSPERAARLEQLAAAVRAGTYQVDAAALSRAIVEESLLPEP